VFGGAFFSKPAIKHKSRPYGQPLRLIKLSQSGIYPDLAYLIVLFFVYKHRYRPALFAGAGHQFANRFFGAFK
jgi:hypothetical protein